MLWLAFWTVTNPKTKINAPHNNIYFNNTICITCLRCVELGLFYFIYEGIYLGLAQKYSIVHIMHSN